ncbi:hypothetical protein A3A71_03600 [Candidatus Berkelbacteria bacterium RIFCSPLOWO2_01_FULL_50_28]|uniref:GP-PDE domain-containing protein n=1 Tax=Candidatus Berkelbacteria bacterium RIFCSPLOWO2_01_FULL_50_28 TaxID=1797471 RepID=A0A1F5ECI8_9BACT|nr:MAG: hypothetical protein A2807_03165 [Candidatus Berkelbacteria bacterium RIFCSPHIGHO2_01_FULL_50_36]OGD63510.1 MAG: hypothetical protein A3F39_00250 [Candidatus Berkelbacteria bacterium RIFCSPHIGHO2_12_FULL_50_11]OGD65139.1 MAG: hypothetical protein A3A71_03600 [Candidatus Berkelbacteria bacterium RIFCSPLOWO2_01_FULL_50_28]
MIFFAHRGGSVETLGNTLSGVLRCFNLGLNIEIDVVACKDALICTHNLSLGSDMIRSFGLDGVRKYRLQDIGFKLDVFPAEGGDAERIPTLLEVLAAAKQAPHQPTVLLDLKSDDIVDEVCQQVRWAGLQNQVIYGVHRLSELSGWENTSQVLAFCSQEELEQFCHSNVHWIRLWQSWLLDEQDQLTDPLGLISQIPGHQALCIMTGGPNHADGGVCTLGQIRRLDSMGAKGMILNDPSLCLVGAYALDHV